MFGAQVIAEGGAVCIGEECVVMENAVLRSTRRHSLSIGDNCLVGPNAHVVGCTIENQVFVATGASIFHAARIAKNSEVRINGVVHLNTRLMEGAVVPIGWVAVGDPAEISPPEQHDAIWERQKPLNFPLTVYGIPRDEASTKAITQYLCRILPTNTTLIADDS
jgi:carbonic anhydrase/acetyltransferase-like protein (isoleucine patch superfamily)